MYNVPQIELDEIVSHVTNVEWAHSMLCAYRGTDYNGMNHSDVLHAHRTYARIVHCCVAVECRKYENMQLGNSCRWSANRFHHLWRWMADRLRTLSHSSKTKHFFHSLTFCSRSRKIAFSCFSLSRTVIWAVSISNVAFSVSFRLANASSNSNALMTYSRDDSNDINRNHHMDCQFE